MLMKNINEIKAERKVTSEGNTNKFLDNLYTSISYGRTENNAVTFTRSGSPLLDFFAQAGAMRKNPDKALELFKKAYAEDHNKAVKILFYLRDVRGGQGERDLFRTCLQWLGETHPKVFEGVVEYVSEYGRWDDILFDNNKCFKLIDKQLDEDRETDMPSLLAKWLPTVNASSPTTRAEARFVADKLGLSEIAYRKTLRDIRKKIATVEEQMSKRNWSEIDYSAVPSQAARIYRNAFRKHDEERYEKFIEKAQTGEEKINTATLFPHQVYKSAQDDYSPALEALWSNLPDYTQGNNALVVADVSGSMSGDPISVSVSLALYFAERNKGQFKDYFITFSEEPELTKVQGSTLIDRMNSIESRHWDMNTDLQAVFNVILETAVANSTPESELPSTIYIISDMEFDQCCDTHTNFEHIKAKYNQYGYAMPTLVFWNVDARNGDNLPVQKDEKGVTLVSGFSPVGFKMVVEGKTSEQVMLDTINSERYAKIEVPDN